MRRSTREGIFSPAAPPFLLDVCQQLPLPFPTGPPQGCNQVEEDGLFAFKGYCLSLGVWACRSNPMEALTCFSPLPSCNDVGPGLFNRYLLDLTFRLVKQVLDMVEKHLVELPKFSQWPCLGTWPPKSLDSAFHSATTSAVVNIVKSVSGSSSLQLPLNRFHAVAHV